MVFPGLEEGLCTIPSNRYTGGSYVFVGEVPARIRTMAAAAVTIVLPSCMQLPSCSSHFLLLLLLLSLLPLSLGQCRVAGDQGGAEYTLVQQSSSSSEQKRICLTESQVFRREGVDLVSSLIPPAAAVESLIQRCRLATRVDYCFTEQQHYGAVYTRTGLKS